ncbi:MAG TPA: sulfite exporter TauE/SafE family protein [Acidimicrobiales bacterium]|nr:sulfite exporter TauE/SafE family protein [Acidimicrobiales bacterium]
MSGPVVDVLAIGLGVLTGILSGAFGLGGAVISTPGVRLLGASTFVAVGTTLPSILPGAVAGTIRYARDGLVDWPVVAGVAPTGVVAAGAGSLLSHVVPGDGHWLMVLTATMVGLTALGMARTPDDGDPSEVGGPTDDEASAGGARTDDAPPGRRSGLVVAGVGAAAGLLSGLLGLGGGLILIPAFSQVVRLPLKATVATSLACVGILAIPGTVTHAFLGDIDWRLAFLLVVGVVPGARLGASLSIRASDRRLRLAVASFLGLLAVVYGVSEVVAVVG